VGINDGMLNFMASVIIRFAVSYPSQLKIEIIFDFDFFERETRYMVESLRSSVFASASLNPFAQANEIGSFCAFLK
jgi:hypothetical protein